MGYFGDDFTGQNDPTNSVIALKNNVYEQLTMSRANLARLSSLKGKVRNITIF